MMALFPVQVAAKSAANGRKKYGYFLEMGLGKTLLTLTEFDELVKADKVDIMMIFCPNSLISTWKREHDKHGFTYVIHTKPERVPDGPCIVIYNYESIIATPGKMIPIILANNRVYGAFDESVQMKNHRSVRWKYASKWAHLFTYVRLLSGRPMVQSPMDLWTQLTLLGGAVSPSPYAFRNRYCKMGGWMNKQVVGSLDKEGLREITKSVSFMATKAQWTDLPDKLYTDRAYLMTKEQQQIYDKMFRDMVVELVNKSIMVEQAVHKFSKLQQIGSGFMFDEHGEATPLMEFKDVPKVKVLDEILEETEGKVIIFAHYRPSVEALAAHYGGPVLRGGMKEHEIQAVIDEFNNGPGQPLVAQLAASKYGLTLLGNSDRRCNTTVYFENNYSLDARIQSEDRNHRHGQVNNVLYIDLIGCAQDRKIISALQRKDSLSRTILGIAGVEDEEARDFEESDHDS